MLLPVRRYTLSDLIKQGVHCERHTSIVQARRETESFEALDYYIKLLLSIPELLSPVRRYTLSDLKKQGVHCERHTSIVRARRETESFEALD
jgi:hypothetical protein